MSLLATSADDFDLNTPRDVSDVDLELNWRPVDDIFGFTPPDAFR